MKRNNVVCVMSFGFKYGPPPAADFVEDVRWVKNPFYEPALRSLTGADELVQQFILNQPSVWDYLGDLRNDIREQLRLWLAKDDTSSLVLAFGCTGGKHRSRFFAITCVDIASELLLELGAQAQVTLTHRDDGKE